jgi:hypothetical protein
MFETDPETTEVVENGIVLRMGVAKGVRIVQNDGNPMPALVLDCEFAFVIAALSSSQL